MFLIAESKTYGFSRPQKARPPPKKTEKQKQEKRPSPGPSDLPAFSKLRSHGTPLGRSGRGAAGLAILGISQSKCRQLSYVSTATMGGFGRNVGLEVGL